MGKEEKSSQKRLDRAQGCLVGLAVGDALGSSVEFLSPNQIQEKFGVHQELTGEGWLRLQPGEVTDETQMARLLGESLKERGQLDPENLAKHLIAWIKSKPLDIGPAEKEAIERMQGGVEPTEAGLSGEKAIGCGAAIRGIPLGIRYYKNRKAMKDACFLQASLTHSQEESCWGSYVIASLVGWMIQGYSPKESQRLMHPELENAPSSIQEALKQPVDLVNPPSYIGSVLNAVCCDFFEKQPFEPVLTSVVNRGGDSDASGAIAGALAGACYGLSGIPKRWSEAVQFGEELAALAQELLRAADTDRRRG